MSTDFATGTDATDSFEYDDAGHIESWERTGFGSGTAAYEFDAAGNLTSKTRDGGTTSYSYNAGNQLTTETVSSIETTHAYDEFGRLVRSASPSSVTTYTWDPLGHLSRVTSEGLAATYEYGISGMRERKTVVTEEGTRTTQSVWAGMQLVAELDSDGTRYEYVYGGGIPLELIVTTGGTGATTSRYAYQVDAGGSVIGITDENGDEVARYAYDPYGVPIEVQGASPIARRNPLRYRGYYFDTETGNYYMPARYYEPESARFLSVDPAPPKAGDPTTLNSYSYCFGDPVGQSDPDGREPHGRNMPDGYGESGYNYGYDSNTHSSMPEARAHAAKTAKSAAQLALEAGRDRAAAAGMSPLERAGYIGGGALVAYGATWVFRGGAYTVKAGAAMIVGGGVAEGATAGASTAPSAATIAGGVVVAGTGVAICAAALVLESTGIDMMRMGWTGKKDDLLPTRMWNSIEQGNYLDPASDVLLPDLSYWEGQQ